uniref:Sucrase-isomaltase, intestinal-like n=1 Tax=Saccoglossus kowalevskii TaxID=10224 RepID=A0ABM0N1B7_SACKO|nr:PREDICTED: sucrase-isomaltase, intestinal-like [Saccoglossus kowalevskii]
MERKALTIVIVCVVLVVCVAAGLIVYFATRNDSDPLIDSISDLGRFDCFPEPNADQSKCEKRGCIWKESLTANVPWCYYPSVYGYKITGKPMASTLGTTINVQWIDDIPKRYSDDVSTTIEKLRVDIEHQTDTRLRIKIYDASKTRFEVPLQLPKVTEKADNPLYDVTYTDSPFSFQITRVDTGTVIFDTSVGGFTFIDKFIQISTKLPSSNVYGFGEHNHRQYRHNLDWKTWAIFTRDVAPVDEWNLYGAQPLHMCIEDDGNAHGVLLLNSNAMDIVLQPTPALTYRTIGGILDFYFFLGPSPEDIVNQYTVEFTGPPMMPPYWALGFQLCKWGYESLDEVKGIVEDMRTHRIPHVWPGKTYYPDFTNPVTQTWWTNHCKDFHDDVPYDALWIDMNEPSNFVPGSTSNPSCNKNSFNFPPYLPRILGNLMYDKTICMDSVQHSGLHYDLHSLYGHSMSVMTFETLKTIFPNKRSMVLTRSQFAGTGHFSGHWLGDNQSQWRQIPWSVVGMLEYALFGFPYIGADICGFWYNTTESMCQRWQQLGAFYPYSRNHNADGWTGEEIPESNRGKTVTLDAPMDYIPLHLRGGYILPTQEPDITTTQSRLNSFGLVVALGDDDTAIGNMFWDDGESRDTIDNGQYTLLSFAATKDAVTVDAYFPNHRWYDYHTGGEIPESNRGKTVTLDAPMDYIPLHLRGGYILPTQEPNITTVLSRFNSFGLVVALGEDDTAIGNMFWDDGESRGNVQYYFSVTSGYYYSDILLQTIMTMKHCVLPDTIDNGQYTLLSFAATKTSVTIQVNKSTYTTGLTGLSWDILRLFGLQDKPTEVVADGVSVAFEYNSELKVLTVSTLRMRDISVNHQVTWS